MVGDGSDYALGLTLFQTENQSDHLPTLRPHLEHLIERVSSLKKKRPRESAPSAAELDWWVTKVVTYNLGPYLKTSEAMAQAHITPIVKRIQLILKEFPAGEFLQSLWAECLLQASKECENGLSVRPVSTIFQI